MRRFFEIHSWEFYHIYNKWFNSQNIFFSSKDYERFLNTIIRYQNEYPDIWLYSYCLMPNHFYFLIKENLKDWNSNIPNFMRKLQNSYAKYFNLNYDKKWPVFIWRYNAKQITTDEYLQMATIYINFNPIKHKIVEDIKSWDYSSYYTLFEGKEKKSTPVLKNDESFEFSLKDAYNKYINEDSTPVLIELN